jgi:phage regulator Rha-like protein
VEAVAHKIGYDFSGVDAPKNEKDYYGLRYAEFVVPLVKATQEMYEIIQEQQQLIENMASENKQVKDELEQIKEKLGL